MACNVGGVDRLLRGIVGIVMLSLVFVGPETPWGWLGLVPLATALLGWCPPYVLLGINTARATPSKPERAS